MTLDANSSWNMSDGPVDYQLEGSCELYSFIINTVFVGTFVVVGVIGNSFAFVVFWKESIKSSALFLFQCLSLIDSALLLTVFPVCSVVSFVVYTGWLQGYWAIYPYILVYLLPLACTASTATIWVTVLVAVNRYIAICLPFRASRWCTVSKAKKQLAFVLLFALLLNIPKFIGFRVKYVTYDNGTTHSAAVTHSGLLSHKLYYIVYENMTYFIFNLALPAFVLMLLNIRMIIALKAFRRTRIEMQSVRQQQDNNITFVLIIVLIICRSLLVWWVQAVYNVKVHNY